MRPRDLQALDRAYVWHPFTPMADWERNPGPVIVRAKGMRLVDAEGKTYLDGVSSLWCNVHGHRVPAIDRAIRRQIGRVAHSTLLGLGGETPALLARELVRVAPKGLTKVFFSDDGSTAMEVALKMAFQFWRQQTARPAPRSARLRKRWKRSFLALGGAYHGDTVGAVSLGGIPLFHRVYEPLLFRTYRAPAPYAYRCPKCRGEGRCNGWCVDELERLIRRRRDELAAVVIEPLIQGAAGMIVQPPGYLARARAACDRSNVLLIADEVATGFGRTGALFACGRAGVAPDLMAVAKGLTGGYLPLAATLATREVFDAFLGEPGEGRTFFHGHTYGGNALACAAALANLELFKKNRTLARLRPRIRQLEAGLARIARLPNVGEVRQVGFMAGIELVADRRTRAPFPPELRMGHRVILAARRRGAILRPLGDVVVLMPPLAIGGRDLERLLRIVEGAIRESVEIGVRPDRPDV